MPSTYHHGSLSETLLTEGRRLLDEQGLQAVTLRELARRAGVSHAAPQRHFADRDALLDALAARGFEELTDALVAAGRAGTLQARLTSYAHTHVRFARAHGPLVDLMFSRKLPGDKAADRFFALGAELLGEDPAGPLGPLPYLVAGTLEGIGSLAATGRLPADRVEEVVDAAVAALLPVVRERLGEPAPD